MVGQELALRHPGCLKGLVIANSSSGYGEAGRALWSQRMADLLESGHLLTFVGEGHTGVGGKSACVDDAAITFLVSGTLPPEGTRCND
jgi:hypothetical protein